MIKKLLFIWILALPLLAFAEQNFPKFSPLPLELNPISQQENAKNLPYRIQITYPELKNSSSRKGQQQLNELITSKIQDRIQQFKQDATSQNSNEAIPQNSVKSTLFINYDSAIIEINNKPIVSIRFKIEKYIAGMAHPEHQFEVINYNLTTTKLLTLDNIFLSNKSYLDFIANYCANELTKTIPKESFIAEGASPLPENYQFWNLRAEGLLITFNASQVAPYYLGPQTVIIPYPELKNLLTKTLAMCSDAPEICADVQLG